MRTLTHLFFITVLSVFICTACGYRGPLYIPDPVPSNSNSTVK